MYVYCLQGVWNGLTGPTLPDLEKTANANLASLSNIYLGRTLGGIIGLLFVAFIADHVNNWLLLSVSQGLMTLGIILIPWMPNATSLSSTFALATCGYVLTDAGKYPT